MPELNGLPNGIEETPVPPIKRGPGRPRKDASVPAAAPVQHAAPAPKTSAPKKTRVVVRGQAETVYIEPVRFARLVPVVMDMAAKMTDNGRLATITHAPMPDSGQIMSAELGSSIDAALIASGVELGPMETALMNVALMSGIMLATYKALPADIQGTKVGYEAGVAMSRNAQAIVKESISQVQDSQNGAAH